MSLYLKTWAGGPTVKPDGTLTPGDTVLGSYVVDESGFVLLRTVVLAEKHHNAPPTGGELTTILVARCQPSDGWTNIAESSLITGQRCAYQGQGSMAIPFPLGAELQAWVWLSNQADLTQVYFAAVSIAATHD